MPGGGESTDSSADDDHPRSKVEGCHHDLIEEDVSIRIETTGGRVDPQTSTGRLRPTFVPGAHNPN
jgi:hypothetical protein